MPATEIAHVGPSDSPGKYNRKTPASISLYGFAETQHIKPLCESHELVSSGAKIEVEANTFLRNSDIQSQDTKPARLDLYDVDITFEARQHIIS